MGRGCLFLGLSLVNIHTDRNGRVQHFRAHAGPPTSLVPVAKVSARMICDIRIEDPRWEAAKLDALTIWG